MPVQKVWKLIEGTMYYCQFHLPYITFVIIIIIIIVVIVDVVVILDVVSVSVVVLLILCRYKTYVFACVRKIAMLFLSVADTVNSWPCARLK